MEDKYYLVTGIDDEMELLTNKLTKEEAKALKNDDDYFPNCEKVIIKIVDVSEL